MLFGGLAEIVSLGLIVPFLAFLVDPLKALEVPVVSMAANILGITESSYKINHFWNEKRFILSY